MPAHNPVFKCSDFFRKRFLKKKAEAVFNKKRRKMQGYKR